MAETKVVLTYEAINIFTFQWFGAQGKREIEIWSREDPAKDPGIIRSRIEGIVHDVIDQLKARGVNFTLMPSAELAKLMLLEDESFTGVSVMDGNKGFAVFK